jgi:hypothetical protein
MGTHLGGSSARVRFDSPWLTASRASEIAAQMLAISGVRLPKAMRTRHMPVDIARRK